MPRQYFNIDRVCFLHTYKINLASILENNMSVSQSQKVWFMLLLDILQNLPLFIKKKHFETNSGKMWYQFLLNSCDIRLSCYCIHSSMYNFIRHKPSNYISCLKYNQNRLMVLVQIIIILFVYSICIKLAFAICIKSALTLRDWG